MIAITIIVLIIGLFALGVWIYGLCVNLDWVEAFKQIFNIGQKVAETAPEVTAKILRI